MLASTCNAALSSCDAGRDVVSDADHADVPDAPQRHQPLAVLWRLLGPGGLQLARRAGQAAEVLRDQGQRLGLVELARHDQHDVVRLVVLLVERLKVLDRHALDVAAVADRGLAVVVPVVGHRFNSLHQHARRRVLASLEFVAHHGHLRIQVLLLDEAVHHAVGLEVNGELQVLVRGRQGLEIVHPIQRGAAIERRAVVLEGLRHVGVIRRALEDHVLQQMRHARLAVTFLTRADQHGQVDRDLRLRVVREKQDTQAVLELVFGDALNAGDLLGRRGISGEAAPGNRQEQGQSNKAIAGAKAGQAQARNRAFDRVHNPELGWLRGGFKFFWQRADGIGESLEGWVGCWGLKAWYAGGGRGGGRLLFGCIPLVYRLYSGCSSVLHLDMNRRAFLRLAALAGMATFSTPAMPAAWAHSPAIGPGKKVKPFELEEMTIAQLQGLMASGKASAVSLVKKYRRRGSKPLTGTGQGLTR